MKIPNVVKRLIDGTCKIDPRHLLPRRIPQLKHKLASPQIPPKLALHYSRCLVQLGHDPQAFNLPSLASALPSPPPNHYDTIPYISPAQRRVQRELPSRLAKINFIQHQMSRMPEIIAEWREKKRANKASKQKKYPY